MLRILLDIICERTVLRCAIALIMMLSLLSIGCTSAGDRVLPLELENRLAANGSPDDHKAAADLYQQEAQRLETEATKSEVRAARLERMAIDPKGVQRSLLLSKANKKKNKRQSYKRSPTSIS